MGARQSSNRVSAVIDTTDEINTSVSSFETHREDVRVKRKDAGNQMMPTTENIGNQTEINLKPIENQAKSAKDAFNQTEPRLNSSKGRIFKQKPAYGRQGKILSFNNMLKKTSRGYKRSYRYSYWSSWYSNW